MSITYEETCTVVCDLCGKTHHGRIPNGWWICDLQPRINPRNVSEDNEKKVFCPTCMAPILEQAAKRKGAEKAA